MVLIIRKTIQTAFCTSLSQQEKFCDNFQALTSCFQHWGSTKKSIFTFCFFLLLSVILSIECEHDVTYQNLCFCKHMSRYTHMCMHKHKYTPLALPHSEGQTRHNLGIYRSITQVCAKAIGKLRAHGLEGSLLSSPSISFVPQILECVIEELVTHRHSSAVTTRPKITGTEMRFFKRPASLNQGLREQSKQDKTSGNV